MTHLDAGAVIPLAEPNFWQDPHPLLATLRDEHRTAVTESVLLALF